MTLFDFFQAEQLPAPTVTPSDAMDIARDHFGLDILAAGVTPLGSQQDANFLLARSDGRPVGVLKVANPAFSRIEIEAQDAAAAFIADVEPGVRTATNIALPGLAPIAAVETGGGTVYARIIRYLDGGPMSGDRYVSPARWAALGTLAGRASRALATFDHPGVDRVLQWDLQYADRTIDVLAPYVADAGRRRRVEAATSQAWEVVSSLAAGLRSQVVHCDITDDNVVCSPRDARPDGIIDFGDLTRSWAIGELAMAVSSQLRHADGEPAATLPIITAFHRQRPLAADEIAALWPLVVLRAATLIVSGNQQTTIDADNDYATGALEHEWRIFERSLAVPSIVMTGLIADALGVAPTQRPVAVAFPLLSGVDAAGVHHLDLTTESEHLDAGRWLHTDAEDTLAVAALGGGAAAVISGYGQARLTRSVALRSESPATVATGVDVWLARETTVVAPLSALVANVTDHEITLTTDSGEVGTLHLRGALRAGDAVRVGHAVAEGAPLGTAGPGRVWLQLDNAGETTEVPAFVRPEYAPGWLALTRDPLPLFGAAAAVHSPPDSEALAQRRGQTFAAVQEQYYRHPPRIERGWREYLCDTDGRSYLDMVNNVAAIGHGHPDLADAVARQWRRLNTNSRFHYRAVVEFSERLAATLPDPLDTVFLVNSGSEAVDLALRLAFATTGRQDVVAVAEAYHGWTYATDAISTSVADNPNALATRPSWVHTVPSPNSFRGDHPGASASEYGPEAAKIIEVLAAQGHPPAAFICEPFYGNAGGVELPAGYLAAVYAAVRAAGGLAIADEVQVGYGRLGRWFWGFQQQGVLPDIVTVAKAMGNGQPLGAVITTKAIADAYRTQGYFFSSAGGSPVSSVVGLTVLDIIEREGLQANALTVGDHLRSRLTELATRHPIIGAVHGSGLYMGVELVRDRATLEPADTETAAICERMRELGVIVQPTGDHVNVLKMKPPMCISVTSADFFVDMLDRVLSTGW
ncbi:aminotransferase [Mycolicibacterium komossense]|uniref:Aminotransferase n=1 Tax=Mycolicibacterium komossense TaxID=1779 RepID=A0ABT3C810_9MYCO|nr:aminotransferase [Mycolicibacterium komossense]MCV7225593.1 aminotransferase [Mycolicibacterium komossense]